MMPCLLLESLQLIYTVPPKTVPGCLRGHWKPGRKPQRLQDLASVKTSGNTRLHDSTKSCFQDPFPPSHSLARTYCACSDLCMLVHAVAAGTLDPGMAALFPGCLACPANAQPHAETLGAACTPAEHAIDCSVLCLSEAECGLPQAGKLLNSLQAPGIETPLTRCTFHSTLAPLQDGACRSSTHATCRCHCSQGQSAATQLRARSCSYN